MDAPERYPHDVYTWQGGQVMVFDQFGDQMPELQGRKEDVWEKIQARKRADTDFHTGHWRSGRVARDESQEAR